MPAYTTVGRSSKSRSNGCLRQAGSAEATVAHLCRAMNAGPGDGRRPTGQVLKPTRERKSVEQVQFFSGLETDGASWGDRNFRTRPRIASDPGLPRFDAEYAKTAQLDAVACRKSILHAEEDGIDGGLCLDARQARAFGNFMYHVLFDQVNDSLQPFGCAWLCNSMLGSGFPDCQWSDTLVHSP